MMFSFVLGIKHMSSNILIVGTFKVNNITNIL